MQMITAHRGQLQIQASPDIASQKNRGFATGLPLLDDLAGPAAFARASVHEILAAAHDPPPIFFATILARAARESLAGSIIWSDPHQLLYPPAISALGIPLDRVLLLRPKNEADELWALTEALRCPGVAAALACPRKLSTIEARRLQLAAERGGGVGLLIRTLDPKTKSKSLPYAAATRWLVQPIAGERTVQKWKVQLIHGHGGQVGQSVILEASRATNTLRASLPVADRQVQTKKLQTA
jgi:protein ImuA